MTSSRAALNSLRARAYSWWSATGSTAQRRAISRSGRAPCHRKPCRTSPRRAASRPRVAPARYVGAGVPLPGLRHAGRRPPEHGPAGGVRRSHPHPLEEVVLRFLAPSRAYPSQSVVASGRRATRDSGLIPEPDESDDLQRAFSLDGDEAERLAAAE